MQIEMQMQELALIQTAHLGGGKHVHVQLVGVDLNQAGALWHLVQQPCN